MNRERPKLGPTNGVRRFPYAWGSSAFTGSRHARNPRSGGARGRQLPWYGRRDRQAPSGAHSLSVSDWGCVWFAAVRLPPATRDGSCHDCRAGAGVLIYEQKEGRGIGLMANYRLTNCKTRVSIRWKPTSGWGSRRTTRFHIARGNAKGSRFVKVRLLSNNPDKVAALEQAGVQVVERVPCEVDASPYAEDYFKTKKEKLGHLFTSR